MCIFLLLLKALPSFDIIEEIEDEMAMLIIKFPTETRYIPLLTEDVEIVNIFRLRLFSKMKLGGGYYYTLFSKRYVEGSCSIQHCRQMVFD